MVLLTQMATFAMVVENGSFTKAAGSLGVSKSVVSKQVTELENHLGVRLLNRTTRRLHLTEAGEAFFVHCQRVVAAAREAELAVAPLQHEPRGTLRISVPQSFACSRLSHILRKFQLRYPRLTLEVRVTGRMVDLVEEGVDVALRIGELANSSLIARRLAPCTLVVCASEPYWQAHGRPAHPGELAQHNCLIYTEVSRSGYWQFQDKGGEVFTVAVTGDLHSDDARLLLNAALADQGVCIGPSFMFDEALEEGRLETVLEEYNRLSTGLYAIYPYSRHVASKVRVFVDFFVDTVNRGAL